MSFSLFVKRTLSQWCKTVFIPISMANWRPISLYDTTYKIIFKIIVRRLKPVLDDLINPTGASFVPRRQISDNVLLVQEESKRWKGKDTSLGRLIYQKPTIALARSLFCLSFGRLELKTCCMSWLKNVLAQWSTKLSLMDKKLTNLFLFAVWGKATRYLRVYLFWEWINYHNWLMCMWKPKSGVLSGFQEMDLEFPMSLLQMILSFLLRLLQKMQN